jgi:hypothetical protein
MKTITAKEFQRQHASIVKEVTNGNEYEVTFHRKPCQVPEILDTLFRTSVNMTFPMKCFL